MKTFFYILKSLLYTFIFLGIFNSSYAKIYGFNQNANNISNYFSSIVSFDDFDYESSENFFKKLNDSQVDNQKYFSRFIQSLINLEKYSEAYSYSKKLDKEKKSNFESNIFLGLYEFKNGNFDKSQSYFKRLKRNSEHFLVFDILKVSLEAWTKISKSKKEEDIKLLDFGKPSYYNLEKVQKVFANCYLQTSNTEKEFLSIIQDEKSNFSRYSFFAPNYFFNKKEKNRAIELINSASEDYPRNLLINQYKKFLEGKEKNKNSFNCTNSANIMAEVFYILANVLSAQENYKLSNFYINLSKFLNPNFLSYDSLIAENFFILKKYDDAKKIYKKLFKVGSVYRWYSSRQIASIMEEEKKGDSIKFLSGVYENIDANIYDTFDFANFLRNKEDYKESIKLYSKILTNIDKSHKLYPGVLERRGMAYERNDDWDLAEKDLIESLNIRPDDAYTMNYLAYSWIEKNQNIDQALSMLRKANNLKKNNGYITDSLGWALFKSGYFLEAKKYLEIAIVLMPTDPIINDHYADCLWMNNNKIQARYYWNYVLKSDKADEELKIKVEKKYLFGLQKT